MENIDQLLRRLDGVVSAGKQAGPAGAELTVKNVMLLESGGALDFGGSEYKAAKTSPVKLRKSAGEEYGWWHLTRGRYQVQFNESLMIGDDETAVVTPHPRLLQAGASHGTVALGAGEELFAILDVTDLGLSLKQNCRISRLNVVAR